MTIPERATLLRIFIGETDRYHGIPLHEHIVRLARERHLAGATAVRGISGYGASSRLHKASLLDLSLDLPIVVEIVDAEEKIEAFLAELDECITEGLVTLEAIRVAVYRHR